MDIRPAPADAAAPDDSGRSRARLPHSPTHSVCSAPCPIASPHRTRRLFLANGGEQGVHEGVVRAGGIVRIAGGDVAGERLELLDMDGLLTALLRQVRRADDGRVVRAELRRTEGG